MVVAARDEDQAYHQSQKEEAEIGAEGKLRKHRDRLLRVDR
jgi:hypothetical protein